MFIFRSWNDTVTQYPSYVSRTSYSIEPNETFQRVSIPTTERVSSVTKKQVYNKYLATPKIDLYLTVKKLFENIWAPMNTEKMYVPLPEWENEFRHIKDYFLRTTRRNLVKIETIERIQNPFLQGRYLLKKIKLKKIYNKMPTEELLFHGTKLFNLHNICLDNFDYRKVKKHEFGEGVSFARISHYASHYCDKNAIQKVMIVAKVLICRTCNGGKFMKIPDYYDEMNGLRYDSSQKPDGRVIVKYNDDEFYPAYKIIFTVNNTQAFYAKSNNTQLKH